MRPSIDTPIHGVQAGIKAIEAPLDPLQGGLGAARDLLQHREAGSSS